MDTIKLNFKVAESDNTLHFSYLKEFRITITETKENWELKMSKDLSPAFKSWMRKNPEFRYDSETLIPIWRYKSIGSTIIFYFPKSRFTMIWISQSESKDDETDTKIETSTTTSIPHRYFICWWWRNNGINSGSRVIVTNPNDPEQEYDDIMNYLKNVYGDDRFGLVNYKLLK